MAHVVLPHRWRRQPQLPVGIDWSNPLTRGIIFAINPAANFRDLSRFRRPETSLGTVVLQGSARGTALAQSAASGSSNCLQYADDAGLAPDTGGLQTHLFVGELPNTTSLNIVAKNSPGVGTDITFALQTDASSNLVLNGTDGNGGRSFTGPALSAGGNVIGVSYSGGTSTANCRWLLNGAISASVSGPAAGLNVFSTQPLSVLNDGRGSQAGINGGNLATYVWWNRAHSDGELAALYENPWQLFRPLQRRIYIDVAAAADTLMGQACF